MVSYVHVLRISKTRGAKKVLRAKLASPESLHMNQNFSLPAQTFCNGG